LNKAIADLKLIKKQATLNQCFGAIINPAKMKTNGEKKRQINLSVYGRRTANGII
jgi:hypothetical protein